MSPVCDYLISCDDGDSCSTALLYYDYALTVTSEIEWYWSPPSPSAPFILFTVSRYFGLLGPIPVFLEYFGGLPEHVSQAILNSHLNVRLILFLAVRRYLWQNVICISTHLGLLDVARYNSIIKYMRWLAKLWSQVRVSFDFTLRDRGHSPGDSITNPTDLRPV